MKPVVIIAIAVVCSVAAVLGVLFALTSYTEYEAELKNQEIIKLQNFENEILNLVDLSFEEMRQCFIDGGYRTCLDQTKYSFPIQFDKIVTKYDYDQDSTTLIEYKMNLLTNLEESYFESLSEFNISKEMGDPENWKKFNEFLDAMKKERESGEITTKLQEEFKGIPLSEIKTGTPLTKTEIMDEYRTCMLDNKSKSKCIELVEDLYDERCRWITNSPSEYDSCFLDMSVFRE